MSQQLWSFIRNFSTTKYYDAIQQGALTGAAPFSFGAIFATQTVLPPTAVQVIFGNSTGIPGTGFGAAAFGELIAYNGTVGLVSGPIATGAPGTNLVNATDPATAEALANAYKSGALGGAPFATSRGSRSPMSVQLVHIAVTVPAVGNQVLYLNGHSVSNFPVGLVTNSNPVAIGVNSAHALPCDQTWIAGCWYHNAVYTNLEMAAMQAACVTYKDLAGPSRFITATDPTYMWSIKRGNFDARATWLSDGSSLNPVPMTRHGLWSTAGLASDVLAAEVPWMQV